MGGWISVGLGAAAALCPLPHNGDVTVLMDHSPARDHLVVCAPDVWVDMGYGDEVNENPRPTCAPPTPPPVPPPAPAPPLPSRPATPPPPAVAAPPPARPAPEAVPETPAKASATARPQAAPEPLASPPRARAHGPEDVPPAPSTTTPAQAPAPAPGGFRWEPRSHYTGGPSRPAPAKLSMAMSTVVVTLPGVLAAAALRPGSRRRSRG
ncbi:hypothetical protein ACIOMM_34260 [Streptomyces sp. NPDC087908]|uniref:hypothetical protein n=1 Tax=Streptomyces sp. NPDC087908 TaxID=3365820 RepID=UPI0038017ACD